MTAKLNPLTAAPALMKEWHRTSVLINSSLEADLSELVKVRASQINGCANCLNMHCSASTIPSGGRQLFLPMNDNYWINC
jgi:alkylhydroperoxidase family enzyme